MKDLVALSEWLHKMADERDRPVGERDLASRLADEVDAYLGGYDPVLVGLFL